MELKANLQKAKEATQVAKEVSEAAEMASYEWGVQKKEMWLAKELTRVCRDSCNEVWVEALNQAKVPATFEWRLAENIYYPKDIREALATLSSPTVLALPPLE